jgi:hypothetical protein
MPRRMPPTEDELYRALALIAKLRTLITEVQASRSPIADAKSDAMFGSLAELTELVESITAPARNINARFARLAADFRLLWHAAAFNALERWIRAQLPRHRRVSPEEQARREALFRQLEEPPQRAKPKPRRRAVRGHGKEHGLTDESLRVTSYRRPKPKK